MSRSRHLQLTFPEGIVTTPVIYEIVKRFDVVPNIRRANIANHVGWMVLELSGDDASMDSAVAYLESEGIGVANAEGDIVAG
jgi:L-aspartate semialdehyde sulfurtransferase ferredoxin